MKENALLFQNSLNDAQRHLYSGKSRIYSNLTDNLTTKLDLKKIKRDLLIDINIYLHIEIY